MKHTIAYIIVLIIVLIPSLALAQSGPPDTGGDPGTPIDGGASLLVGAAAVYGIKNLKDRKTKERTDL